MSDLVVAAIIQAVEDDPSRTALSNDEAMRAIGVFGGRPPAPYTLRRAMVTLQLRDALAKLNFDIAKLVYHQERWYVIDATYMSSRYYQELALMKPATGGPPVLKKMKTTKVYAVRGLITGVVVALRVADENVNDETMFEPLFTGLIQSGAIVRGGGVLADAGFNRRENYELVRGEGGMAFLDFNSNARLADNALYPHYNEQLKLYWDDRDRWHSFFNFRPLIECTNHGVKAVKATLRAKTKIARECEVQALIAGYNLCRLPELRLTQRLELPFVDERALRYIDRAIQPKRRRAVLGSVEIATERADDARIALDSIRLRGKNTDVQ